MIIFKDYLVQRLSGYILDNDSYKDNDGKGFVQRFIGIFGEEIDEELYNKIEEFNEELSPLTLTHPEYLDYFAVMMGDLPRYLSNDVDFARLLTYILSIYRAKGTERSYQAILGTLGFDTVILTQVNPGSGVYDDDPLTNYDTELLYDDGCKTCSDYSIALTGTGPISASTFQKVKDLISLVEPINVVLTEISYNGDPVTAVFIEVIIDSNGDLIYDNANDPGLVLTLVNGDLIISGPNENKYFIDENGDLYYIN